MPKLSNFMAVMPQLQINQGPQDALLYDNSRSYFTNVGYLRTSNFQVEYRDLDAQNNATLGSTVQFIVPKAADLLGPVDLMVNFKVPTSVSLGTTSWVETVGFAMIEKIMFSVGSHDVETITGDQLNIMNELMKSQTQRLDDSIGKFGYPAHVTNTAKNEVGGEVVGVTMSHNVFNSPKLIAQKYYLNDAGHNVDVAEANENGINATETKYPGLKLIIPLGLFFTKHPSQYFPLAAIAGCNEVRISVKFRSLAEIVMLRPVPKFIMGSPNPDPQIAADLPDERMELPVYLNNDPIEKARLRCHYVHVTGPEATTLMNKEHVRLLKLFQTNTVTKTFTHTRDGARGTFDIDLSFLHPVSELIITIRKTEEIGSTVENKLDHTTPGMGAVTKNRFAYQGGDKDPNIESVLNSYQTYHRTSVQEAWLKVNNFKLTLNGQERHPSLASTGIDRDYMMARLIPSLHSNCTDSFTGLQTPGYQRNGRRTNDVDNWLAGLEANRLRELLDRKEIYVYPFSLNPEGGNPSGAVNFSKVSHAKLSIDLEAFRTWGGTEANQDQMVEYQVDVYGVNYNWLQIKDGRALTSFA